VKSGVHALSGDPQYIAVCAGKMRFSTIYCGIVHRFYRPAILSHWPNTPVLMAKNGAIIIILILAVLLL
jgi:hypothetical protein